MAKKPVVEKPVALTMGEPSGICPEITHKAWQQLRDTGQAFYLRAPEGYCDDTILIEKPAQAIDVFNKGIPLIPLTSEKSTAHLVVSSIQACVKDIQARQAQALVTNPVQKEYLYNIGFNFPGHTEFLGSLTGATPVMMLACEQLRVVPVTVHVPLKDVAAQLSLSRIIKTAEIVLRSLEQQFNIKSPRLAVAGLNPHAGENGHIGLEERKIIEPAIRHLKAAGNRVDGPYPADTLFHDKARTHYDAVLCMYHDQALIPIKTLDFWGGVNVTLGLPFLRTSPDHGTGIDIAGQGIARADSLVNAIKMACRYG